MLYSETTNAFNNIYHFHKGKIFMNTPPMMMNHTSRNTDSSQASTKFWGVWLPVPTLLAIVNTLFWTWLILSTVGYTERGIEKAAEEIIEKF